MTDAAATKPVVLVHGAWHGAWCWDRVTPLLDAAGVPWGTAELPSCADIAGQAGVAEDVDEVTRILDELPGTEPVVLLGHSRGGLVLSEAGVHDRVGQLVYLCALLLEPGEDVVAALGPNVMSALEIDDELVSSVKPDQAAALFYNDCTADDRAWAAAHVSPMYIGGGAVEPRRAWESRSTTYVVCELDAAIPPEYQHRMAGRADDVLSWETGHSPFVNRPDLVADLLIGLTAAD